MTAQEIRALVQRLFKEGPLDPLHRAARRRVSLDEIERRALVDPAFAGQLAKCFSDVGQRLPEFITHPAMVRFNRFLLEPNRPDPDLKVALAHALNLPGSEPQRDLVRAILICEGTTLESTAALLHLDLEVVSIFEPLNWNVIDRKPERPYIARLCGQIGQAGAPGGVQPRGLMLLGIAYEPGSPEAVLAAAGVSPLNDLLHIQMLLQQLRSGRLASTAVGVAREKISDEENPDLRAVLRMIAARKKAKADNGVVPGPRISFDEAARMTLEQMIGAKTDRDQKDSTPGRP